MVRERRANKLSIRFSLLMHAVFAVNCIAGLVDEKIPQTPLFVVVATGLLSCIVLLSLYKSNRESGLIKYIALAGVYASHVYLALATDISLNGFIVFIVLIMISLMFLDRILTMSVLAISALTHAGLVFLEMYSNLAAGENLALTEILTHVAALVVFVLIAFGSLKIYVETAKTLKADTATKTEGFKHVGDMADYIYEMISRLGTEIEILKNGSNEFRQSLNGVTAAIDSIAEGSISVVSDTEKIAHHISELEKALSDNNGHIKQVARNMEEIIDNKNQGLQLMNELRRQSAETSGAIAEIDKMISETNETTNKIISAGETIRQISTQTRLLALNAAIEASRAGETSRGFAVIAEQIRNLSDETNKYLEEIQDYTKVLAENVDSAVGALDRVKAAMENELEDVKKMDGLLDKINASTTSTQDYIVLVNKSSDTILEQTTRIKESIESLYAANQECAANTSQSSTNMQNQAPYVESIINLINNLCGMVYSLRDKSMEIKMLIDAGLLVDYLEKEGYSNENLVKACRKLNLTTAYVADRTGYVHYCNEEIGRGVNLFEFDSSLRQLLDGVDYVATPIKKRVEDGKTYKFLSIYRNNWIYEVGLDLTRTALDQTGTN